jgi:hypothetical protein
MGPYDPRARAVYLDGFHKTTLAQYNNVRKWPGFSAKSSGKDNWVSSIVRKEQAMLRKQVKEYKAKVTLSPTLHPRY